MFNLLPKDEKFYDELEQLSALVVHSSENLETIIDQFPKLDGQLDTIERDRVGGRAAFRHRRDDAAPAGRGSQPEPPAARSP